MAEVGQYGGPECATCGGRGITTDVNHHPHPCVPCSLERREEACRVFGYSIDCRACEAVLTVEDMRAGQQSPRPWQWGMYGPLCGPCMRSVRRTG